MCHKSGHKLFDLGVLGLNLRLQVMVSATFSARTPAGRAPSTTCTAINSHRDLAPPCPRLPT
jgi:hypothetical protein